jgi:hypothetical protein
VATASDLVRFARRDWRLLAELKAEHWSRVKREYGAGEALRVGDELRRLVKRQHPGWPGEEDRRRDLETHVRVAAALQRAQFGRRS